MFRVTPRHRCHCLQCGSVDSLREASFSIELLRMVGCPITSVTQRLAVVAFEASRHFPGLIAQA